MRVWFPHQLFAVVQAAVGAQVEVSIILIIVNIPTATTAALQNVIRPLIDTARATTSCCITELHKASDGHRPQSSMFCCIAGYF